MEQYQVLDNVIKTLSKLRVDEILIDNSEYLTFRLNEINHIFKNEFGNIEKQQILSAIPQLEKDGLISIVNKNALIVRIGFNSDFFKALDINEGWYSSKHFKEQMELDLLATRLEKLSLELNKIESTNKKFKDKLPIITAVTATIASTLDIISKIKTQ